MKNEPAEIRSLAVDARGRIVVGLAGKTISIYQADGKFSFKFATHSTPRITGIDVTCKENIVVTFINDTLQMMDYAGSNVKVVQPPPGVNRWEPSSVCCSKRSEIFALNLGEPKAVYRYTAMVTSA